MSILIKDKPTITICWKLLDIFFEKIEGNNLENVRLGLLFELDKSFLKYSQEYGSIPKNT